ncbi:MAG: DNA polymerase III subunit gamma/tau [Rhizobiaceae bacterium]
MSETGEKIDTGPYRVLARKYRPQNFSDLIGQEPMVRTLTNAFEAGRIAQAWMLTGVRGVGKTTTARILARALNYKSGDTDQPSIQLTEPGEHCEAIMEGRHQDVLEMDAASHTGIDAIRDIIDQVRYAPVSARYKVYIIDEVHMLTTQAFNGLLKTLEEPPPHVKFIFATTEIRKVPITVLSRCQRFDLRRVDAGLLTGHLQKIAELEKVSVEEDALAMIARAAEGSVRDSLSILDQAIAHGANKVDAATVRDMLGLADRARIIDLFEKLMAGDVAAALAEYREQYDVGADPAVVLTDLAEFNHLVTRLRFVPDAVNDASLTEDEKTRGLEFAGKISVRVLSRTWQMLLKGIDEVQRANHPLSAGEMVLVRIAHAAELPTLDEALKSLESAAEQGTSGVASQNASTPKPSPNGGASVAVSQTVMASGTGGGETAMKLVEAGARPDLAPASTDPEPVAETVPVTSLADIAALADQHRDMQFKVRLKQYVRLVGIVPGRLDISLVEGAPKTLPSEISQRLSDWCGTRWMVSVSREQGGPTLAEEEARERSDRFTDAKSDPTVAAILSAFPGARIIDVRMNAGEAVPEGELPPADDDDEFDF